MFALLPDPDQAVVTFLAAHVALTPLHGGRVGTQLAAGELPALRVSSLGGTQPWPWQAVMGFQIESWGGDRGQANLLARTVEAAVYDMRGPVTGGRVVGVAVALSLLWSPDEDTDRPRYLSQVDLTIYPEAS